MAPPCFCTKFMPKEPSSLRSCLLRRSSIERLDARKSCRLIALLSFALLLLGTAKASAQDAQVPEGYQQGLMWPTEHSEFHGQILEWLDNLFFPLSDDDPFGELVEQEPLTDSEPEIPVSATPANNEAKSSNEAKLKSEAESLARLAAEREAKELRDLEELFKIENRVAKLKQKVIPCVVSIGESGSGVLIKSHGIVLTASHVTQKAGRRIQVRMYDGRIVDGITLGSNAANDTSAIRLLDPGPWPYLKTVPLTHEENPGDWCVAFGYPMSFPRGRPAAIRLGRITGTYNGKLVADCPIMGGDSGGPLVDLNGNVLAVCSSVKMNVKQNMYVPIERYREDWLSVMSSRDVDKTSPAIAAKLDKSKPFLGIFGESGYRCVRVRHVHRGSPAEFAGLVAEDVIHSLDGKPIEDFNSLLKIIHSRESGEKVVASIVRFGEPLELNVKLGSQN